MPNGTSVIGRLFTKGSVAEQIFVWAILAGVVEALGEPGLEELRQLARSAALNTILTPAELTDAVVKGHMGLGPATAEAGRSGVDAERFKTLVDSAGEPPGLEFLLQAWRREFIPEGGAGADSTSLEQGIRESRLKDKWIGVVKQMGFVPIPVAEAVDAVVESQISHEDGERIAFQNGVTAANFQILVNTRGNPPSPTEVIEMVRRGKIPLRGTGPDVISLQQAIYEGATKNKWEPVFEALTEAIPPPRTVVALIRAGVISDQDGARFLQSAGLSTELSAAYVAGAHHEKTQHERNLTVSQILDLYEARAISAKDATTLLADLHYSDTEAAQLLSLRDLQREIRVVNQAISRVGKLYVARKIERDQAVASLGSLQLPSAQVSELISVWDQERAVTVRVLTPAEVVAAFHWEIFDQATATQELIDQGYTPRDAWALLSIRQHTRLPNQPAG